jgi:hypothetical protein
VEDAAQHVAPVDGALAGTTAAVGCRVHLAGYTFQVRTSMKNSTKIVWGKSVSTWNKSQARSCCR